MSAYACVCMHCWLFLYMLSYGFCFVLLVLGIAQLWLFFALGMYRPYHKIEDFEGSVEKTCIRSFLYFIHPLPLYLHIFNVLLTDTYDMCVNLESSGREWCWRNVLKSCLSSPLITEVYSLCDQLSQKRRDVSKLFVICDRSNIYFYLVLLPFTYGWAYCGVILCCLLSFLFSEDTNINVRTYQDFMAFCTCEPLQLHIILMYLWLLIS